METTKNDLPPNTKKFFYNLSEYLDTKLLYYGSVQRSDYVPGKSDIDVIIFFLVCLSLIKIATRFNLSDLPNVNLRFIVLFK